MGSPKRLKKKDELRYRKGSTNETQNCEHCASFVKYNVLCDGEKVLDLGPRCKILGLEQSVRYRVRADYTCDVQQSTYKPPVMGGRSGS
jgi:hypothetical protein